MHFAQSIGVHAGKIVSVESLDAFDFDETVAREPSDGQALDRIPGRIDRRNKLRVDRSAGHCELRFDFVRRHRSARKLQRCGPLQRERASRSGGENEPVGANLRPGRLDDHRHPAVRVRSGKHVILRALERQRLERSVVAPAVAALGADIDAIDANADAVRRICRRAGDGRVVRMAGHGEIVLSVGDVYASLAGIVGDHRRPDEFRIYARHRRTLARWKRAHGDKPARLAINHPALRDVFAAFGDVVDRVRPGVYRQRRRSAREIRAFEIDRPRHVGMDTPQADRPAFVRGQIDVAVLLPERVGHVHRLAGNESADHGIRQLLAR